MNGKREGKEEGREKAGGRWGGGGFKPLNPKPWKKKLTIEGQGV
jgi:hypothetical protein